jgi:hypothetical protein
MENIPYGFLVIIGIFVLVAGSQILKKWLNCRLKNIDCNKENYPVYFTENENEKK